MRTVRLPAAQELVLPWSLDHIADHQVEERAAAAIASHLREILSPALADVDHRGLAAEKSPLALNPE
jgi:hypothetical protein